MNKTQWTAVIKAYIWCVASSATDFTDGDIDIITDLCRERSFASDVSKVEINVKKNPKKSESEYIEEYESVLNK